MINKKLLAVASLVAVIFSSSAFAYTRNHYVGIDMLTTNHRDYAGDVARHDNLGYGVGFNYKYAFNFNGLFIAPGTFYNLNHASVERQNVKATLRNSYGFKVDVGYDTTSRFAPFVSFGYLETRNEYKNYNNPSRNEHYTSEEFLYGIGMKYSVLKGIDTVLAYEYYDANEKSKGSNALNSEVLRLGVAYRFTL
ncbi:MAG: hypothetical protein K0R25_475 [Rickettsiaceae bacterium]|jgi:opacity protein-like surface antigen|nr:hypothetical protein [Rickettsiaceae bacterium]